MNKKTFILSSCLLGCSLPAWSAAANETLVVTANHFEQPISSVLASIDVINRSEIARWQAHSVGEILNHLPGIVIAANGGRGQMSSIFVRGSEARHVLLLVDGVRLNGPSITGTIDFSQIPVALIQRIEYIRGPYAATYGSDAIGGVINIITERDDQQDYRQLNLSYGSNAYQNYNLALQQQLSSATTLALAGGYEATTGYDVYPSANEPDKDGFRSQSLWINLKHQFTPELSGFVRGYAFANRTEYDGNAFYPENERQLFSRNLDLGLQLQQENSATQLIASYQHYQDYNYPQQFGKHSVKPLEVTQQSLQLGQLNHIGTTTISSGFDLLQERAKASASLLQGHSRHNWGTYLTAQHLLSAMIIEAAVRADHNQQSGWHTTWQSALGWNIDDYHTVKLSYGTAFRAPSFYQLYHMSWTEQNLALQPEKSRQIELALQGDYADLSWSISGYINQIDDLIDLDPLTWNRFVNIDSARIKGVEFTANWQTDILQHKLLAEYLDARYRGGQYGGRLLARRPHQRLRYEISADLAPYQLTLAYQYIGRRLDSNYSDAHLGGYSRYDVTLAYQLSSNLILRGKISNLFDKQYATAVGYPAAGREYSMTLSYDF